MTHRMFFHVSEAVFALVALLHLLRLVYGWSAQIGGWQVPMWASVVALVAAGFLALSARNLGRRP
ncbi:hypothetical protein HYW18_02860 [Candidatus Uhrbacteria bacterium]|nr:hypothetical protein [Candidatus Uhrbacteria bacterium]